MICCRLRRASPTCSTHMTSCTRTWRGRAALMSGARLRSMCAAPRIAESQHPCAFLPPEIILFKLEMSAKLLVCLEKAWCAAYGCAARVGEPTADVQCHGD